MYFQTYNISNTSLSIQNLDDEIIQTEKRLTEFKRDLEKIKKPLFKLGR